MLSRSESKHYSPGPKENVPKVVEDGDSPLQSALTAAQTDVNMCKWRVRICSDVNMSKCRVRAWWSSWFKELIRCKKSKWGKQRVWW